MGGRNQTFTNNFELNSLAAAHPGAKVQVRMIRDKLKSINLPVVLCSPSQLANGWTKGTLFSRFCWMASLFTLTERLKSAISLINTVDVRKLVHILQRVIKVIHSPTHEAPFAPEE